MLGFSMGGTVSVRLAVAVGGRRGRLAPRLPEGDLHADGKRLAIVRSLDSPLPGHPGDGEELAASRTSAPRAASTPRRTRSSTAVPTAPPFVFGGRTACRAGAWLEAVASELGRRERGSRPPRLRSSRRSPGA
jgi:hypothetical protein